MLHFQRGGGKNQAKFLQLSHQTAKIYIMRYRMVRSNPLLHAYRKLPRFLTTYLIYSCLPIHVSVHNLLGMRKCQNCVLLNIKIDHKNTCIITMCTNVLQMSNLGTSASPLTICRRQTFTFYLTAIAT